MTSSNYNLKLDGVLRRSKRDRGRFTSLHLLYVAAVEVIKLTLQVDFLYVVSSTSLTESHQFVIPNKTRSKSLKLRKDGRKHGEHEILRRDLVVDNRSLGNGLQIKINEIILKIDEGLLAYSGLFIKNISNFILDLMVDVN